MVNIQINGIDFQARPGAMIIEVADEAGIVIPRFCYHKKLSIAASCRMCLVEVEKVGKALPACATPVTEGMKVFTRSPRALMAQKAVMEFLLVNHPLDCPVCDQGGECPLQETAIGFGGDVSYYTLGKRVVANPDLGPLVATDMTRCIHCTRCVRFSEEIAGVVELGAVGRGEHTTIGTYVEHSLSSELSGNLIDICPVGALTSKPYRYTARPWELKSVAAIGPHDSFGSHLSVHVRRGRVMRVVAREREDINESWISDRDRFSYQALQSADRLLAPRIRRDGVWSEVDWSTALEFAAKGLGRVQDGNGAAALGALVAPTVTLEEAYLVQKLMRAIGSPHVDHRLRQLDFSDQSVAPVYPWLGQSIVALESLDAFFVIGSHVRKEHPMVNHRLRKAVLKGAQGMYLDGVKRERNHPVVVEIVASPKNWPQELAAIASVLLKRTGRQVSPQWQGLLESCSASAEQEQIADRLARGGNVSLFLGNLAVAHPQFASLRALAALIAELVGARLGYLAEGAGTVGAWLAGAVPHRGPGGQEAAAGGLDWRAMVDGGVKGFLVLGAELDRDCADSAAGVAGLQAAEFVVCLSSWTSPAQEAYAHVQLPIAAWTETAGTYVNGEGRWQSFQGAVAPAGESRPAWKVLRVLGNLLDVEGFEYLAVDEVLAEAQKIIGEIVPSNALKLNDGVSLSSSGDGLDRFGEVPPYGGDGLVRRAPALQQTVDGQVSSAVRVHPATLERLGLAREELLVISQGNGEVLLPLVADTGVAEGCAVVLAGLAETASLGVAIGPVQLAAVGRNG